MNLGLKGQCHRFDLSPGHFVIGLLVVECLLLLSKWVHEFAKGWAVLIALASVGAVLFMLLVWFAVGLIFRQRFQFSVRSLFVLALAVALPCGWLAWEREQARRQNELVKWIIERRGSVWYDWSYDGDRSNPQPSRQEWLRNLLGDDFFDDVAGVRLAGSEITNADLQHLKGWVQIRSLSVQNSQITDAGLEQLSELALLNELWLDFTQVTDVGLKRLQGSTRLHLLHLNGTKVTDAGLEILKGFAELHNLNLNDTEVTNVGLETLKGLTQLQDLSLVRAKVTDAGVQHLKGLAQLRWLSLSGTNITDDGLKHLEGLTRLDFLYLYGTQVSGGGVQKLQQALPNCKISH